jgi:DNA modification methylase
MKTVHRVHFSDSRGMRELADGSVALVVTSPPYPMIEMWDALFSALTAKVRTAIEKSNGVRAFELMHAELDPVWQEVHRILCPGGMACINVGDAARSINGSFMLYPNHARILSALLERGFTPLPSILWRKPTNAPNKFMGSGMYPAGAYVTLEHEHVLIVRKGAKRAFATPAHKQRRRESAVFWEERNQWYSDVWFELKGSRQGMQRGAPRGRSGAFPFELAYRLIQMFSVKGDTVVDPFLGTGTTLRAASASGRHGVGYEIEGGFRGDIFSGLDGWASSANTRIAERLADHLRFVDERTRAGGALRHCNRPHGFPVITSQERDLRLEFVERVTAIDPGSVETTYRPVPAMAADPVREPPPSNGQLPLF